MILSLFDKEPGPKHLDWTDQRPEADAPRLNSLLRKCRTDPLGRPNISSRYPSTSAPGGRKTRREHRPLSGEGRRRCFRLRDRAVAFRYCQVELDEDQISVFKARSKCLSASACASRSMGVSKGKPLSGYAINLRASRWSRRDHHAGNAWCTGCAGRGIACVGRAVAGSLLTTGLTMALATRI